MPNYDLTDQVMLVAGSAENLGGLINREFVGNGAKVVVYSHSQASKQGAGTTVQAIQKLGCDALALRVALTKLENVTTLFEQTK